MRAAAPHGCASKRTCGSRAGWPSSAGASSRTWRPRSWTGSPTAWRGSCSDGKGSRHVLERVEGGEIVEDDVSKTPEGGAAGTDGPTAGSEAEEGTPPKRRIINQPEPEPLDL